MYAYGSVQTPANLIGQVAEPTLRVVGWDLELPNTNKPFYRVVAIDGSGNESGPSDYVEVPRPCVVLPPIQHAKAGQSYEHMPIVIRSIGDLRCYRSKKSSYNAAFWDSDAFSFEPVEIPTGLALDKETGSVSGTAPEAGAYDVRFKVSGSSGEGRVAGYRLIVE